LSFRRKIDDVEVVASDEEVWFLQGDKMCWTTREELWSGTSRLMRTLQEKGYRIHAQTFHRKLRELALHLSREPITGSVPQPTK